MSIHIRPRNNGRSFELRITHKLLPKPYYRNFDTCDEARAVGDNAERFLALGVVPEFLLPVSRLEFTDIAGAIRVYERRNGVPPSTADVLATVCADIGSTKLSEVNYLWAESWVRTQKLMHHRAPGTIRHHVGGLARCLDWVTNAYPTYLAQNPLRKLPRGYATYNKTDCETLRGKGLDSKGDVERNRRIEPDEQLRVVALLRRRIDTEVDATKKAWHEGALLIFQLAQETAMRMRELYTLEIRLAQIDLARKTVFLHRTKNGDRREVPLSSVAIALLEAPLANQQHAHPGDLLFPFWNGDLDPEVLALTTSRLSAYFAGVFADAKCDDLVFHDTRTEGVCRFVLRTTWDSTRIARATGHRDPRSLRRYMSLRGSEMAASMW